jgi:excisionase family DNA binding protein
MRHRQPLSRGVKAMTEMYSIAEARKHMGIGHTKLYEEIGAGRLKAKKCGKKTLITADAISAWFAALPDYPTKAVGDDTSKTAGP